jgi:hypothetical protein
MEVWAPPVPRQRGRVDTSSTAFESSFKDLEALLCNCLYTICGLHGHSGSWQDRACTASAFLRFGTAISSMAAEIDLAHLQMLREVMRRVNNERGRGPPIPSWQRCSSVLLQYFFTPSTRPSVPPLGSHSALLSATPLRTSLLSPATASSAPGFVLELASGLRTCLDLQQRQSSQLSVVALAWHKALDVRGVALVVLIPLCFAFTSR